MTEATGHPGRANGSDWWQNKVVIVTGGSGFLGSFVAECLRARGVAQVIVPRTHTYDLREVEQIRRLYSSVGLRSPAHGREPRVVVVHLAARVGLIGANAARPAEFFYDNLTMGVSLMHEAWRWGVEKFIAVGTVCAYPKLAATLFRESDLWYGYPEETNAPYGLAMKMRLVQSSAYRQQYGFNSIFLLPVNIYGPRDNFSLESSHVIPALIRRCIEAREAGDEQIVCWGTGTPTREFLYVEDAAEGIVRAAERYESSEPVNLGSGSEISIRELSERIAFETEYSGNLVWDHSKPDGQPRRRLEVSAARRLFSFEARTSLDEGLRRTVAWYEAERKKTVE